ncbi:MAG: hypothetical protein KDA61_14190, partial [Planctomycetales bacterium]|nr:hypothetical protein [Planctomycetales bacterium]
TRINAQHIDVNRDARQLQSAEGRLLRQLVLDIRPEFAFNLHNQNARSVVGGTKRQATVSLLAPPLDAADTQTPHVLQAKRVAVCFLQAVERLHPGGASRYDADYMSRAFGEWIQNQGAVTVLVEAGGMHQAGAEASESTRLVTLHLQGMIETLESIATDAYRDADPQIYDALPRSGEHAWFDCLLREPLIVNGCDQPAFRADLGIQFPSGRRVTNEADAEGVIEEIGDLEITSAKHVYDGSQLICLPGGFAWRPTVTPLHLPDSDAWSEALGNGCTTMLGSLDPTCEDAVAAFEQLVDADDRTPGRLAFVLSLADPAQLDGGDGSEVASDLLLRALSAGAVGAVDKGWDRTARRLFAIWKTPLVEERDLAWTLSGDRSLAQIAQNAAKVARLFRLDDRCGLLLRDRLADVQCYECATDSSALRSSVRLRMTMVGGSVVWSDERLSDARPGRLRLSDLGDALSKVRLA